MSARRIDLAELFFSSSGRAGRAATIVALVVLIGFLALYGEFVTGAMRAWTGWLVHTVLFFSAACVVSKRFHDRGRSGWWSAVALFAWLCVWPSVDNPLDVIAAAVLVWAFVELALLPGEPGANRYGQPAVP